MAKISKLKPGQTIFDVDPKRGVFPVHIKSIDESGEFVVASWNGNAYDKMYQKQLDRYRVKPRNGK